MKIGIIAAMEEELRFLLEQLHDSQEHQVLSNTYYTGRLGRHELILVQSGVGKVMSAMTVAMLAERFQADAIINTGSAGADRKSTRLNSSHANISYAVFCLKKKTNA